MRHKVLIILAVFATFLVSPAFADYCYKCGKKLPAEANFCPACGTRAIGAFSEADKEEKKQENKSKQYKKRKDKEIKEKKNTERKRYEQQYHKTSSGTDNKERDDAAISSYEFINDMEQLIVGDSYTYASHQAEQLKAKNSQQLATVRAAYETFSPYRKKLHDLHMSKYKYIEDFFSLWKDEENGKTGKAQSEALQERVLFSLARINQAIDTLICSNGSLSAISRANDIEERMLTTTATYLVSSAYLIVDNNRLNKNEPLWVIDVKGAMARVLHIGKTRRNSPITGYVSIYDMEKRTNWRSNPAFFYSNPLDPDNENDKEIGYQQRPRNLRKGRYPYRHTRANCVEDENCENGKCNATEDNEKEDCVHYSVKKPNYWDD